VSSYSLPFFFFAKSADMSGSQIYHEFPSCQSHFLNVKTKVPSMHSKIFTRSENSLDKVAKTTFRDLITSKLISTVGFWYDEVRRGHRERPTEGILTFNTFGITASPHPSFSIH